MQFSPLGKFNPDAPLSEGALAAAIALVHELREKHPCPVGSLKRIYKHWTVGHYDQDFNDYNLCLRYANGHFYFDVCGDPRDNAVGVNNNEPHAHTYRRNTGAFGIATDDMAFANEHDFGPEPITLATADWLCAGVAAAAAAYQIDLSVPCYGGPYAGEPASLTHGEAANLPGHPAQYDNYYVTGERWDWCTMVPFPPGVSNRDIDPGILGSALRKRERAYKVEILRRLAA